MWVDQKTICEALDVAPVTIKSWMNRDIDPLPVHRSGRRGIANRYDLGLCVAWLVRQKVGEVTGGADEDGPLDYNLERAKLTKAQRLHTELQSEVLRGNLIPKDDVVAGVGRLVSAARSRLLSIPMRFAAQAVSMTEAEIDHGLTAAIHDSLLGLVNAGGGAVASAAEVDGEPMGGSESTVKPRGKRRAGAVEY